MKVSKPFVIIALAIALSGYASYGSYFKMTDANRIRNGMTREQVVDILGEEPYSINGDGTLMVWSWAWVNGLTGATESRALTVHFDANGHVVDVPEGGLAKYLAEQGY